MLIRHLAGNSRQCRLGLLGIWLMLMAISLGADIYTTRTQKLEELKLNARNVATTLVAARAWNAALDGVYGIRSAQLAPNPYLKHPHRDLPQRGSLPPLTMVNPAYMTRMIGDILSRTSTFRIGLRSTTPLNPGNMADKWESQALKTLDHGAQEAFGIETDAVGRKEFRYMMPLKTDESCLGCHEAQGSWIGELRGGLSVIQPYPETALSDAILRALLFHLALFGGLGGMAYVLLNLMENRLKQEAATSDTSIRQE